MEENTKLRKITALHSLERESLQQITVAVPNLEEFTMTYGDTDQKSVDDIVHFMRTANQLKKASFLNLWHEKCVEAEQQLNSEWTATVYTLDCYFIRKNF